MRISDWSSDVCSSDLAVASARARGADGIGFRHHDLVTAAAESADQGAVQGHGEALPPGREWRRPRRGRKAENHQPGLCLSANAWLYFTCHPSQKARTAQQNPEQHRKSAE